jgi:hypothetical protein
VVAVSPFDERRAPGTSIVSRSLAFDLDDVGAKVGQHLSGPRPGQDAGKFEDAEAR